MARRVCCLRPAGACSCGSDPVGAVLLPSYYAGSLGLGLIATGVGNAAGNAFNWVYDLNLKVGDSVWRVAFDDWMYLQPDGVILNRATATRWDFEIGTLTATFHKPTVKSSSLQTESTVQAAE